MEEMQKRFDAETRRKELLHQKRVKEAAEEQARANTLMENARRKQEEAQVRELQQ